MDTSVKSNPGGWHSVEGILGEVTDQVNHPAHYMSGGMEAIDVIEAFFHDNAYLANVFKYIARAGKKNDYVEDLRKSAFYLNREINRVTTHSDS